MLNTITKTGKPESLALVDSVGLRCCFMLQKECPPMLKLGVRKKGSLSYCVRKGYILSYWRTLRAQSGLKQVPFIGSLFFPIPASAF